MRTILILLLLANLTLFAYTRLDSAAGGEAGRLAEQAQPDKIQLLTAQQVAALGPAKVASLADVCLEWGPFADADRARALGELAPLNLGTLLSVKRLDGEPVWSATLGPFANRASAERRLGEVRTRGVQDAAIVDNGRGQFLLAMGTFRSEPIAQARADALTQQGVPGARPVQRTPAAQSLLVVRDPSQGTAARIKELQAGYPGSDVRVGGCEKTP